MQAIGAEAAGFAMQPTDSLEQVGITDEIIDKLQEKAKVLTQKRKSRGRSVPEGLIPPDDIRQFQTLASHPVMTF